jgi:hypothetical protein
MMQKFIRHSHKVSYLSTQNFHVSTHSGFFDFILKIFRKRKTIEKIKRHNIKVGVVLSLIDREWL